jgi:hypothetical protein
VTSIILNHLTGCCLDTWATSAFTYSLPPSIILNALAPIGTFIYLFIVDLGEAESLRTATCTSRWGNAFMQRVWKEAGHVWRCISVISMVKSRQPTKTFVRITGGPSKIWMDTFLLWERRDSSVGIATGYGVVGPGSIPGNARFFSHLHSVQTGSGAHPASSPTCTGSPFPWGVKQQGRETDHSPPSSAEVKNCGATPPLLHMFSWHSA